MWGGVRDESVRGMSSWWWGGRRLRRLSRCGGGDSHKGGGLLWAPCPIRQRIHPPPPYPQPWQPSSGTGPTSTPTRALSPAVAASTTKSANVCTNFRPIPKHSTQERHLRGSSSQPRGLKLACSNHRAKEALT